jgi:hypothetical protein
MASVRNYEGASPPAIGASPEDSSAEIPVLKVVPRPSPGRWVSFPLMRGEDGREYRAKIRVILPAEWDAMGDDEKPRTAVRTDDGAAYVVLAIDDAGDGPSG